MITIERWKELYVNMLLEYDDNLCDKCKHNYKKYCNKFCEKGIETDWVCKDLDFATCPIMSQTPCYKCIFEDARCAFELDESKVVF